MKWLKRTWLSIVRRPMKSVLLLLTVFMMVSLLAGSLAIIQTSDTVKDEIKKGLGAEAVISADLNELYNSNILEYNSTLDQFEAVAQQLCNDERVYYGEYHFFTNAEIKLGDNGFSEALGSFPVILYGTNISNSADFREGVRKLTADSRNFTEEELNSDEALILVDSSIGYTQAAGSLTRTHFTEEGREITISIGLSFWDWENGASVEREYKFKAKVIGSYSDKQNSAGNYLYMSNKALRKIVDDLREYAENNGFDTDAGMLGLDYSAFKLKDAYELDSFDEDAKELLAALPEQFKYDSTSSSYERSAGPVENLDTIAKVIFAASIIATVIVLGLVIIFFVSDRKKEMGIYIALGERKSHLVLQVMCEVLLVSLVAVTMAGFSGILIGNKLSDYMLEVQRYVKREQELGAIAKLPVVYKPVENALTTYSRDEVIDNYKTEASVSYFMTLYAVGTFTVIISCAAPMAYLTHIRPKDNLI